MKLRLIIKILLAIVILFIAIQFIPSTQNIDGQESTSDISKTVIMPSKVHSVLKNAC
jgi:hypothetical protein